MEVGHSRLLKFFTKGRLKPEMAEAPTIKIQKDFPSPPNVEAEVPGTHKIRESDDKNNNEDNNATTSEIQITGAEFTLSPVITVTKKESTLTKGDMKLQKVTVTENIAMEESENGGYRITHAEYQSSVETNREPGDKTVATSDRREKTVKKQKVEREDKSQDEKKSKIPIMRLRQAVEKVKKERQMHKTREPRRSSIPKLKDAKTPIKRNTSLQYHPKLEDEFDKIYEEMVDNAQGDIDDKILAVKIEDAEKVESNFEEIIHAYDEEIDEKQTVSRVSKIPALRRRDDDGSSKISALVDRVKAKNTITETELKDGGFKVTASSIRTKRFSRGNSRDLSRENQKANVTETIDIKESDNNEVRETVKRIPAKPERSIRRIPKELRDGHKVDTLETIAGSEYSVSHKIGKETILKESTRVGSPAKTEKGLHGYGRKVVIDAKNVNVIERFDDESNSETVTVEEFKDGRNRTITTTTTVRESVKVGSPVITETIIRNISREVSTENLNVETVKDNESENKGIEEIKNGDSKKFTKETFVRENIKVGIPLKTERFTRGISREMGNIKQTDNKEIVTVEELKDNSGQKVIKKTITRENSKVGIPVKTERIVTNVNQEMENDDQHANIINKKITTTKETTKGGGQKIIKETFVKETFKESDSDNKDGIKEETTITEKVVKENIKSGIPTFTKVTQSFSKGRIQNVEMSKSIEWKPADEITRKYNRSVSEKVTKKELKGIDNGKFEASIDIPEDLADTTNKPQNNKDDITNTKYKIPKDPELEGKIKDTVKDISRKITTKKVTEYESKEQITNVEKNTYTLSNTIDLNVDRDNNKEHREIRKQISMKDIRDPYFKQDSTSKKKYAAALASSFAKYGRAIDSTVINKESIKTDPELVTEKKETDNNLDMQEKESDTEEVTILKGNVSRLKYKICSKANAVSKKETDEILPIKESILSKIAVYERLEPREAYPVIKPTERTIPKVDAKEINIEEKPKIVDELLKEKPKSDSNDSKVETDFNYKDTYRHEPLEVAKFISVQKDIQTDDNQYELPKILPDKVDYETEIGKTRPGKINLNIWKNQVAVNKTQIDKIDIVRSENLDEIAKLLPGKVEFKTHESRFQVSKASPGKIDLNKNENQIEVAKLLPGKIDSEIKEIQTDFTNTLPGKNVYETIDVQNEVGKIEIETDEIQADIAKPLPDKIGIEMNENQVEIIKTLPRKIDFSADASQTELPKILPDKKEYLKSNKVETTKPMPGKLNLNLWKNQVEVNKTLLGKSGTKKSKDVEIANALPGKIDLNVFHYHVEVSQQLPGKNDFKTSENQVEIVQTFPGNIDFSTTDTQFEQIRTLPGTIDVRLTENQAEVSKILPGKFDFKTEVNEAEVYKPGKIEFETYECQVAESKTIPDNIDFSITENQTDVVSTLPGKIDFKSDKTRVEVAKAFPGKLDLRAWGNQVEVNKTLLGKTNYKTKQFETVKILPGKIDVITYESQVEDPKTMPGKININEYENKTLEVSKYEGEDDILPGKGGFETSDNKSQQNNVYMGFTRANKNQSHEILLEKIDLKTEENKVDIPSETEPRESLSDPELVDEPQIEVGENKQSIIGKLKRKIYFITNKNIMQNSTNKPMPTEISANDTQESDYEKKVDELQTKIYSILDKNKDPNSMKQSTTVEHTETTVTGTTSENIYENKIENIEEQQTHAITDYERSISKEYELNTEMNTAQNNYNTEFITNVHKYFDKEVITDIHENEFNFDTDIVQNGLTRSEYGIGDFKTSREDLKRAKSLAELDLGDAVHGQVKRMVGRIKSVDFGRRDSVKAEKISIKEMPKKMSVLEKIALFEGKSSLSNFKTTTLRSQVTNKNVTQVITEETYLQRIEELTSAKTRLGRLEDMLYLPLANDVEMPVIALGTAMIDKRLLPHLIGAAIDLGYRAIDTAYIYGNEKEIGQAIQAKIDDGTVKREDLFIMSKLWSTFHRSDLVEEACRTSLSNMGLEYFDLYMIHNPMSFKEGPDPIPKIATVLQYSQYDYLDAWFGMEVLVTKGLVKSIGVSNFNSQQIQRILDKGRVKPVINQVECHPYLSQQRLHAYCAERNITLSCFGVLGSKGTPAEYKTAVTPAIDDALIQVMASGLSVSPAQLLIRYQIECGHNVVVKSSTGDHLWDNLQALTFTLDKTQVDALHALNRNKRIFTFKGMGDTHKNYPFLAGN